MVLPPIKLLSEIHTIFVLCNYKEMIKDLELRYPLEVSINPQFTAVDFLTCNERCQ